MYKEKIYSIKIKKYDGKHVTLNQNQDIEICDNEGNVLKEFNLIELNEFREALNERISKIDYEKYSTKEFNDILVKAIMKSKKLNEKDAEKYLVDKFDSIDLYDEACNFNNIHSKRRGVIQKLKDEGIEVEF